MRRGTPAIAVLAVAGFAAGALTPAQAAPTAPVVPPAGAGKDVSVTLITGDRVLLPGGDVAKLTVEPGKGRENVGFVKQRFRDHTYVIPADVGKDVGSGRIDRRLFDVAGLVKDRYDDASSSTIPVLATYSGNAKRAVPAGAKVLRQLPSISGAAMKVSKSGAKDFIGSAGFSRLWLDGKRKVLLDQSVPQIGGPDAWQAGYTGKGVPVAVLDTGVDATHPDLAPQIAGAKNFTTESADDVVGHGTHVASTIAGTGAASDGRYKGVAPDAKIYDGKICEVYGCEESAILAGMEWAATEVKARIVNLSIGGPDTPEVDPLEEAVNRLTAQTGALFVVAAGNSGPSDGTIDSPGSADAALTVGNVTKQDELNLTSSRGPRIGDSAVKPDVTAPGTDIVAAKSKDSSIGEPVGDKYLRLSGTSMATPHTAGAAAILLQEHPSWTAAELKSALMGSAKVAADQTAFQQGAGRINLTTAIKQNVVAEPGSVSFGLAAYPHDDDQPVAHEVTFRNLGDDPVTLALSSVLTGPDGAAAPAGALKLSADSVTVPAGGTASVQATSDTTLGGADGLYSGRITAAGGGQTVVVPVGVDKEGPSYNLTVKMVMRDGEPDVDYPVNVFGVDTDVVSFMNMPDATGTYTVRLPQGEYTVDTFQEFERGPEDWIFFTLVAPSVQLNADRTVVLDARKAEPITTSVPDPTAKQANSGIGFDRTIKSGPYSYDASGFRSGEMFTYNAGPKLPADQLVGHVTSQWGVPGEDGLYTNTPYLYGIANYFPGDFPTGFARLVKQSDLATVDATVNSADGKRLFKMLFPTGPNGDSGWARVIRLDPPRTIRYYVDETPYGFGGATEEDTDGSDFPFGKWSLEGKSVPYKAGRYYRERWNGAAFVPSVYAATRSAGQLGISLYSLTDADGHAGHIELTGSTKLFRDGTEVGSTNRFGYVSVADQPAGTASYKLVTTGTQQLWPFSTRMDLEATFTSSADQQNLPIHTVGFRPDVDGNNTMARTPVTTLPFEVKGGAVAKVKIEYSGDAGATWRQAPLVGGKAVFPTPAGKTVSLRSTATDAAGNTTTQTVIAAYSLR